MKRQTSRVKTIDERVAELVAEAPPMTEFQREATVRLLTNVPAARRRSPTQPLDPHSAAGRAAAEFLTAFLAEVAPEVAESRRRRAATNERRQVQPVESQPQG